MKSPPPERVTPKTKNSTHRERADVGSSIEKLFQQIGNTSERISWMNHRVMTGDIGMSQLFTFEMFQTQLQGQYHRIKGIEKQSTDIKKLLKKEVNSKKKKDKKKQRTKRKKAKLMDYNN